MYVCSSFEQLNFYYYFITLAFVCVSVDVFFLVFVYYATVSRIPNSITTGHTLFCFFITVHAMITLCWVFLDIIAFQSSNYLWFLLFIDVLSVGTISLGECWVGGCCLLLANILGYQYA